MGRQPPGGIHAYSPCLSSKKEVTMKSETITNNAMEKIDVIWDGIRYALWAQRKIPEREPAIIILNPREMEDIIRFARRYNADNQ